MAAKLALGIDLVSIRNSVTKVSWLRFARFAVEGVGGQRGYLIRCPPQSFDPGPGGGTHDGRARGGRCGACDGHEEYF